MAECGVSLMILICYIYCTTINKSFLLLVVFYNNLTQLSSIGSLAAASLPVAARATAPTGTV